MKKGDMVLFTGYRIDYPNRETWLENELVILTGIDKLSQIGCYPDRYTVMFTDGEEQDCTHDCLQTLSGPKFTCPDCGDSIIYPELCIRCFAEEIGF